MNLSEALNALSVKRLNDLVEVLEELRPHFQDDANYFGIYEQARQRLCQMMWGGMTDAESTRSVSSITEICREAIFDLQEEVAELEARIIKLEMLDTEPESTEGQSLAACGTGGTLEC